MKQGFIIKTVKQVWDQEKGDPKKRIGFVPRIIKNWDEGRLFPA